MIRPLPDALAPSALLGVVVAIFPTTLALPFVVPGAWIALLVLPAWAVTATGVSLLAWLLTGIRFDLDGFVVVRAGILRKRVQWSEVQGFEVFERIDDDGDIAARVLRVRTARRLVGLTVRLPIGGSDDRSRRVRSRHRVLRTVRSEFATRGFTVPA